jgi:predicted DNA-binding protein
MGGFLMTTQLVVRIDSEVKERFNKLVRVEGKTSSQMVRELIEDYIKERDIGTYVDDLWNRIGKKLKSKGIRQRDINREIRETRKNRE